MLMLKRTLGSADSSSSSKDGRSVTPRRELEEEEEEGSGGSGYLGGLTRCAANQSLAHSGTWEGNCSARCPSHRIDRSDGPAFHDGMRWEESCWRRGEACGSFDVAITWQSGNLGLLGQAPKMEAEAFQIGLGTGHWAASA